MCCWELVASQHRSLLSWIRILVCRLQSHSCTGMRTFIQYHPLQLLSEVQCSLRNGIASDSYPNVHMPSHSHHNKTWYAYEVQAALFDAVRGDLCAHSHWPWRERHQCHLSINNNTIKGLRAWGLGTVWHHSKMAIAHASKKPMHSCTCTDVHADTSTRADYFFFKTLDPVPYAPHQHLAEFL